MEQEIIQLENKVRELIAWKDARKKERLVIPVDIQSRRAMDKGLFVFTGNIVDINYLNLITDYMSYGYEVSLLGRIDTITITLPILPFTISSVTSFITNTNGQHNLNNGDKVTLTSDNTGMPTPLDIDIIYYVVNRTGNTFQVSLTSGGDPITITFIPPFNNFYYAKLP